MEVIFITGTAGAGKSLLTSRLLQWLKDRGSFPATLNLDPGVVNLPYSPDIDVRDFINMQTLMENYDLGPNGALIMASDMVATKMNELQNAVDEVNPDHLIVDTPGQTELFAFRESGPFFVSNLQADSKVNLFVFDGMLVSSPINYVSIALLASAVRLRLEIAQINVLTKRDMILDKLKNVLEWSSSHYSLESALDSEQDKERSVLARELARSISKTGFAQNLIAVSSLTLNGMVNLSAAISRVLSHGEDSLQ